MKLYETFRHGIYTFSSPLDKSALDFYYYYYFFGNINKSLKKYTYKLYNINKQERIQISPQQMTTAISLPLQSVNPGVHTVTSSSSNLTAWLPYDTTPTNMFILQLL